jgi:hypothetical protein
MMLSKGGTAARPSSRASPCSPTPESETLGYFARSSPRCQVITALVRASELCSWLENYGQEHERQVCAFQCRSSYDDSRLCGFVFSNELVPITTNGIKSAT